MSLIINGIQQPYLGMATGDQLDELVGGGDTTLHDHDGIAENTLARHSNALDHAAGSDDQVAGDFAHNSLAGLNAGDDYEHLIAAQVTDLETLRDGSDATGLHKHPEPIARVTGAATLDATHRIVLGDTDDGAFTITLPAGVEGTNYKITNCGSSGNDLTIDGDGTERIWDNLTVILSDGNTLDLSYNATEGWW